MPSQLALVPLKIRLTSRPNGQCPKSDEFPTLIEVFSVLAIQKTFDQGSPFANYPLVGTFNHIHFGGKSLIMSGTRSK